jgi:toxin ParE1/3/4
VPRYRVSQRAREDLRQIGLYTQREWGKVQRRKYLSGLDSKFYFLTNSPLITPERQEFFPVFTVHASRSELHTQL